MNINTTSSLGNDTLGFSRKDFVSQKLKPVFLVLTLLTIIIIGIIGITGNSLVFYLEYKRKKIRKGKPQRQFQRSLSIYFIKSLALSDLISSVIHTPLGIVWLFYANIKSDIDCQLNRIAVMSLSSITILNITFIAVERFLAVYFPFKAPSINTSKVCVVIAWILGFVIGIIHILPLKAVHLEAGHPNKYIIACLSTPPDETLSSVLLVFHTVLMYVLPNTIVLVSAIAISVYLRKKKKEV